MVKRGSKKGPALQTVQPNNNDNSLTSKDEAEGAAAMEKIMDILQSIDDQVEEKVASIMSAAEDAIFSLRHDLKAKIMRLSKPTREMNLKEFQEKYPEDFKTGVLQEIRDRYAAMAEAAQQAIPPMTSRGTKRGAEPVTVLRTVKARRTANNNTGPLFQAALGPPVAPAAARRGTRGVGQALEEDGPIAAPAGEMQPRGVQNIVPTQGGVFNGRPLQTPMPFAGQSLPMPVTMLTQKRGGRTKAAPAADAAVVTTSDGMQWALGKDGVEGIPESHRAEVADLLRAQFDFLAAALGRTVFDRQGGRSGRR